MALHVPQLPPTAVHVASAHAMRPTRICWPVTPVFLVRSLPARSTRLSLLQVERSVPSPALRTCRGENLWGTVES